MTYVCSPLSADTKARTMENVVLARVYMQRAEEEFGDRAVAPHAVLPLIIDDTVPKEREIALEFGLKLLGLCSQLAVYGPKISNGMKGEIEEAKKLGIPIVYRMDDNVEGQNAMQI